MMSDKAKKIANSVTNSINSEEVDHAAVMRNLEAGMNSNNSNSAKINQGMSIRDKAKGS